MRKGKLDKLEVAELLVGRTSLKEWRKMTKLVRMERLSRGGCPPPALTRWRKTRRRR